MTNDFSPDQVDELSPHVYEIPHNDAVTSDVLTPFPHTILPLQTNGAPVTMDGRVASGQCPRFRGPFPNPVVRKFGTSQNARIDVEHGIDVLLRYPNDGPNQPYRGVHFHHSDVSPPLAALFSRPIQ